MTKNLDMPLDECIDRINKGESLEACLASYPQYTRELKPLLRTMGELRDTCSAIPGASAKSQARRRLDAALVNPERDIRQHKRRGLPFFRWGRVWASVPIALVLALLGFGLYWMLTPGISPVIAQNNFRLLISDEQNAIGDFDSLEVTITSFGALLGGETGGWEVIEFEAGVVPDLTDLPGLNAQEIWNGVLPEGQYTEVFIYIDDVSGMIDGESVEVKLPSGKLHISKPFAITADDLVVNFVYDVTVIKAGESGQYILLPQANQSGANQSYHEVGEGDLTLQVEGTVAPGEEITVHVTFEGDDVEGALVTVEDVGEFTTGVDGRTESFIVPYDEELEIEAVWGELEGELEIDLGD